MRRSLQRALIALVAVALVVGLVTGAIVAQIPSEDPISCFVVHCEPTNATGPMFLQLVDLVALADEYEIPLTIYFTAQWAEMILADEGKAAKLAAWLEAGHEIGGHHHAYWGTLERASKWDGYTNTPVADLQTADQDDFRGTMDDYMAILDALPGEMTSACMGLSDERDRLDWPCVLRYGTTGHALEHAVSQPYAIDYDDCSAWLIDHALILQPRGALAELYEETGADRVFCVVGHVYNFAEDRPAFEVWFGFLHARDPDAVRRSTVTELLESRTAGEG